MLWKQTHQQQQRQQQKQNSDNTTLAFNEARKHKTNYDKTINGCVVVYMKFWCMLLAFKAMKLDVYDELAHNSTKNCVPKQADGMV